MPLYLSRSSTSAAPFERASGEDTFDRRLMNVQGIDPTSGFIMGSVFRATKTETTTQVLVRTGSTACAATPTTCKIGLYTVDDPSTMDLTRVAVTTNDTTLFAATNTDYTRSWAASTTKVAGTLYAVCVLMVSAVATAKFTGLSTSVAGHEGDKPFYGFYSASGQTDLPATITGATLTGWYLQAYAQVLP